ncbi:MAG: hypothetical protein QNL91_15755, partial [Candidatus Krumholzibacteria bacterium]|nr:hypothetical protein [Candidatus Krumholzibacteria bacterium]
FRATVLRPVLVGTERIVLRAGLRWTVEIARTQIVTLGRAEPEVGKQKVNLSLMGTASHWIALTEPVLAHGPYGKKRWVRAIGLSPDATTEWENIQI